MSDTASTPVHKDEYEIATTVLQYMGNLKLAETTAFIAVTGGLLTVFFTVTKSGAQVAIAVFGVLESLCFFLILESTQYAWFHFARRAAALEGALGYALWSKLPGAPAFSLRPASWALRLFYVLVVVFWIAAVFLRGWLTNTTGGAAPPVVP